MTTRPQSHFHGDHEQRSKGSRNPRSSGIQCSIVLSLSVTLDSYSTAWRDEHRLSQHVMLPVLASARCRWTRSSSSPRKVYSCMSLHSNMCCSALRQSCPKLGAVMPRIDLWQLIRSRIPQVWQNKNQHLILCRFATIHWSKFMSAKVHSTRSPAEIWSEWPQKVEGFLWTHA